jgi:SET domain-containing protein
MSHLPHEGVYTRLAPSKIHGVGVFAIRDIPKGAYVFVDDEADIVWVNKKDIEGLPTAIRRFYDDFAIVKGSSYGCPVSFDKLTNSWFLNDSAEPNVAADREYRFYALRDIEKGEELTADYETYSDPLTSRGRNR